ncbi:MAG TPA: response regulator [Stellaceae bacterium]|nr:response regulator [Stellaceae bacterium]
MASLKEPFKILIVEDEPLLCSYVSNIFREFGFEISGCASSGPEAIALAEQTRPQLAVVDIRLTGPADGVEIARILRDRFNVSTIFLSGVEDEATIARARALRPAGFLKKPFLPSQMLDAIQEATTAMSAGEHPPGAAPKAEPG